MSLAFIRIRKDGPLGQSFMIPHRGSVKIGYAVNQGRGMMEYWSAGPGEMWEKDCTG
jgi:hypothetical protein